MRMIDIAISAAIISNGRSGLTKTWPRLRDHISSRNEIETPIWLRSVTSHSSTPLSSTAPAMMAGLPTRAARNCAVNPQMHICRIGQYINSSSRGQERRYSARCRYISPQMRREMDCRGGDFKCGDFKCGDFKCGDFIGLEQIPFASERERVKMLAKTRSWSRFREQPRAEAALVLQPGFTLRALCSSAPMGAPGALLVFASPC